MTSELHIRRIRPDEGLLLRDLRVRSLSDSPEAFGQSVAEAAGRLDDEWRQIARVASEGDRRAWFLAWFPGETPRAVGLVNGRRRPPDTLLLFSMWVAPDQRREGVGTRLIEALEAWAHDWGATRTVLWVFGGNEPAIRFYEQLGFAVEPDGEDAAVGRGYGAFAMSREITVPIARAEPRPSA